MDYLEILKQLDDNLILKEQYSFSQKDIDNILKICIQNNWKEKLWRLALTLSNYKFDFYEYAKYYIDTLDSYYLIELIYALGDNNLDIKKIYEDVLNTKNQKFINEVTEELMSYYIVSTKDELIKLLNE